ncbi:hypothetical protein ACTHO5_03070 [Cytobacillus praedii]
MSLENACANSFEIDDTLTFNDEHDRIVETKKIMEAAISFEELLH